MLNVHYGEYHIKKAKTNNMTNDAQEEIELLTVAEVSALLRVDNATTRRWIKTGALEAVFLPGETGAKKRKYRIRRTTIKKILGR